MIFSYSQLAEILGQVKVKSIYTLIIIISTQQKLLILHGKISTLMKCNLKKKNFELKIDQ